MSIHITTIPCEEDVIETFDQVKAVFDSIIRIFQPDGTVHIGILKRWRDHGCGKEFYITLKVKSGRSNIVYSCKDETLYDKDSFIKVFSALEKISPQRLFDISEHLFHEDVIRHTSSSSFAMTILSAKKKGKEVWRHDSSYGCVGAIVEHSENGVFYCYHVLPYSEYRMSFEEND